MIKDIGTAFHLTTKMYCTAFYVTGQIRFYFLNIKQVHRSGVKDITMITTIIVLITKTNPQDLLPKAPPPTHTHPFLTL